MLDAFLVSVYTPFGAPNPSRQLSMTNSFAPGLLDFRFFTYMFRGDSG